MDPKANNYYVHMDRMGFMVEADDILQALARALVMQAPTPEWSQTRSLRIEGESAYLQLDFLTEEGA